MARAALACGKESAILHLSTHTVSAAPYKHSWGSCGRIGFLNLPLQFTPHSIACWVEWVPIGLAAVCGIIALFHGHGLDERVPLAASLNVAGGLADYSHGIGGWA